MKQKSKCWKRNYCYPHVEYFCYCL